VILRGGSESFNSNAAIYKVIKGAVSKAGLHEDCVTFIDTTDRKAVDYLLKQSENVDLVIPRGGEGLIKMVARKSLIPVIKHYKGVCHVKVDKFADLSMAQDIVFNAKCQRPGVCNAMETLLVNDRVARRFLPAAARRLKNAGVRIKGCDKTRRILKGIGKASNKDWSTEYLSLTLSVKIVKDLREAVEHISKYGSMHSDAIVTENRARAEEFAEGVDSSCVYVNASTRFTDGNQFGMGAEMGISTDKLHARGPMALEELCTYKYVVWGKGQIRR
jgi:glutamate-5-semialdehyde dehydrogenase